MAHNPNEEILSYAYKHVSFKAHQLIGSYGYTESDIDDIKQDLLLDIVQRIPKYEPTKCSPSTFVARLVRNKICSMIEHRRQLIRDHRKEKCSLNESVRDLCGRMVYRYATISSDECRARLGYESASEAERLDLQLDMDECIQSLPDHLKQVAELLRSFTASETAERLNIPRSTLYERIRDIRTVILKKNNKPKDSSDDSNRKAVCR